MWEQTTVTERPAVAIAEKVGLRVPEAALLSGLSETYLWNAIREGRLTAVRPTSRITLIRRRTLDEFVESLEGGAMGDS